MTKRKIDIHKAAGIIIHDRRLLVERSKNKKFFIAPGGSVEAGETVKQALVRELKEEFDIDVDESDLKVFDTFYAAAAGQEHLWLQSDIFTVERWQGDPVPTSEVEEIAWITSDTPESMPVGSIIQHEVIPRLKQLDLID